MKYKCIIISGPDNVGKDTLCEQICNIIQNYEKTYPVYLAPKFSKNIWNWKESMKRLKDFTENFVENDKNEGILVLNRSWLDEYVYGIKYRGYAKKDLDWLFDIKNADKILYVYLWDDPAVLSAREDGMSFSNGRTSDIIDEVELFDEIYDNLKIGKTALKSSSVTKDEMGYFIYINHILP